MNSFRKLCAALLRLILLCILPAAVYAVSVRFGLPTQFLWLMLPCAVLPALIMLVRRAAKRSLGYPFMRQFLYDAKCRSIVLTDEALLTGREVLTGAAMPMQIFAKPTVKPRTSGLMLLAAAALTRPCLNDGPQADLIDDLLIAQRMSFENAVRNMKPISGDSPERTTGITVKDGAGQKSFFILDRAEDASGFGYIMEGSVRKTTLQDQHNLAVLALSGDSVLVYGMTEDPSAPLSEAVCIGMIMTEKEWRGDIGRRIEEAGRMGFDVCIRTACSRLDEYRQYLADKQPGGRYMVTGGREKNSISPSHWLESVRRIRGSVNILRRYELSLLWFLLPCYGPVIAGKCPAYLICLPAVAAAWIALQRMDTAEKRSSLPSMPRVIIATVLSLLMTAMLMVTPENGYPKLLLADCVWAVLPLTAGGILWCAGRCGKGMRVLSLLVCVLTVAAEAWLLLPGHPFSLASAFALLTALLYTVVSGVIAGK